eukprot:CAMPEP_0203901668 /NCGR_PEP_ID=MMETSP0359-20131031/43801_1 /ASSEMBLY_ACC=CAM_ASM_000338 /TAXON_ID=268821 /ORGANISM="Scrippsiella Hangoei, Strain SHTV-5" /LENGTH=107 /DNA_ID=CAMNT_0050825365 /DNA_START=130 /DNA_END=454 /DNA_ORIENTATION=-
MVLGRMHVQDEAPLGQEASLAALLRPLPPAASASQLSSKSGGAPEGGGTMACMARRAARQVWVARRPRATAIKDWMVPPLQIWNWVCVETRDLSAEMKKPPKIAATM